MKTLEQDIVGINGLAPLLATAILITNPDQHFTRLTHITSCKIVGPPSQ
jgi:hypothetical protein